MEYSTSLEDPNELTDAFMHVQRTRLGVEGLGVHLDDARNDASAPVLSTDSSPCTVRVLPTDEESILARETLQVLASPPVPPSERGA